VAVFAGYWGPELLTYSSTGTPAKLTPVTVRQKSTDVATTLYTDRTKAVTTPNPIPTDLYGNLSFYAEPDEYTIQLSGSSQKLTVVVQPDLLEPGGGGGVTDHGVLTGLADDDHPQYLTPAEGNAAYAALSHTHPASQITDFATAVDLRIQNVIGTAPAALDTLGELADALSDDANFAATMTTSLAGKQPIDTDLTTIAALAPADGSVLARVSGAWNSRTAAQFKADLALDQINNTSDLNKPISTATQTALNGKAALEHSHHLDWLMAAFGFVAMTGHPASFTTTASPAQNAQVIFLVPAPPGKSITGTLARSKVYDFDGNLLASSPDDPSLWLAAGWRLCTLTAPFAVPSNGLVFIGMSFGGFTGAQFLKSDGANTALWSGLLGNKRYAIFDSGASDLPASFNPATFGATTSWIPLAGLIEA
jgi:hypothetical protein